MVQTRWVNYFLSIGRNEADYYVLKTQKTHSHTRTHAHLKLFCFSLFPFNRITITQPYHVGKEEIKYSTDIAGVVEKNENHKICKILIRKMLRACVSVSENWEEIIREFSFHVRTVGAREMENRKKKKQKQPKKRIYIINGAGSSLVLIWT